MIHVSCVLGQASWIARTTGTVWHVSPMAERRTMHSDAGGWTKGSGMPWCMESERTAIVHDRRRRAGWRRSAASGDYSTVTDFARLRG